MISPDRQKQRSEKRARVLTFLFVFITTFIIISTPRPILAQSASATLSGTIEDQNGAIVPDVSVVIQNVGTSLKRETTTSDQGFFTIPLLPPGTYTVMVRREGFTPLQVQNVVLNVGDNKALQIQLKAGDVNAQVTIDSNAETIRTDGSVGTVVDQQFVANIPLNGRSLQSLISLTPGVVFTPVPNAGTTGGQFSVNGQRTNANYFTVDGVSANYGITVGTGGVISGQSGSGSLPAFTALGGTNSLVSIDALQEFKIETSSFAAEFGRTPGGQISLLTRSGTNIVHGSLFEYLRNDVLDANDWFANRNGLPRAKERQNDFGGVIGGPIIKNKTFFFFSYEGLRLRQPTTGTVNVPTLQARQQAADAVKPFINAYPIPNRPEVRPGVAQFVGSYSNPGTLDAYSIRIDHALRQKMTLFGNYRHSPSQTQQRAGALNEIDSRTFQNNAVTVGFALLASASMTNDLRFNWSRARTTLFSSEDSFGGAALPDESVFFSSPKYDTPRNINNSFVQWLFRGAASNFIGRREHNTERQLNLVDTFSWVKRKHQLKFGADYRRISPVLGLDGYASTILGFNLLPQQPALFTLQLSVTAPGDNVVLFRNFSAFAQDTFTVNRKLTLTYGLRWELSPPPHSINGRDPSVLANLEGSGPAVLAPRGTTFYKTRYSNFAPRFGVSDQLSQRPGRETILRGGVGVFYDLGTGVFASAYGLGFPYWAVTFKNGGTISYPHDPSQVPFPVLGVTHNGSLYAATPNLKTPYTAQWNATLEQSLGRYQTLTVSYVGAAGRRLLRLSRLSLPVDFPGSPTLDTIVSQTDNRSKSDYRAIQIQFQRRLSRGVQGLLSYSFGRSYDISSDDTANFFDISGKSINLNREYGPSDFDVRHSLSGALTVDLPAASGQRAIKAVTRDWGLDALLRFRTPLPTNLTTFDVEFSGVDFVASRPNVVPGVQQILYGSQYPGGKAVNPAAFVVPPANTQGDFPRNSLRFFNASQLDFALRRQFSLTEQVKLQFRFEFFNLFNHPNFAGPTDWNPGGNASTRMLSRALGGLSPLYQIGGPRSGQVGLKLIF